MHKKAFTLIELLIVVAIIAILAAIAVPNFLEAQVRAKVSRVKSDFRTYATAIESYAVDQNKYPREQNSTWYGAGDNLTNPATGTSDPVSGIVSNLLSTPIAYISTARFTDIFMVQNLNAAIDEQFYTYQDMEARSTPPFGSGTAFWAAAVEYYGKWRLISLGPDRLFGVTGVTNGGQMLYDPTNGTVSPGNIIRAQGNNDRQPFAGAAYPTPSGLATLLGVH